MQLNKFKAITGGIIARIVFDKERKDLFRPMKVTHERFLSLAIKGKQPAVSMQIQISDQLKDHLGDQLIMLGHKISGKSSECSKSIRLI